MRCKKICVIVLFKVQPNHILDPNDDLEKDTCQMTIGYIIQHVRDCWPLSLCAK